MNDALIIILVLYLLMNISSLSQFWSDKRRAVNGDRRIPENTLLVSSLFGPFGAFIAMSLFHHKTLKLKFKLVSVFMVIHVVIILVLAVVYR